MRRLLPLFALLFSAPVALAEVTVFAAASLKTALDEIAADWQAATGMPVLLAYGGSAAMAKQIAQGAPADIFISGVPEWMDDLAAKGLIRADSRRELLGNRLVLVAHGPAEPIALDATTDLAALLDGGRLSMGMVDSVAAGKYGAEALRSLGLWDQVQDSLAQSENVRVALRLVALGEAPLGIVFTSDAVAEPGVTTIATFPEASHQPIRFSAALTVESAPEAAAFLDHLAAPVALEVFLANGFTAP